jgi:hypothetical protein
MGAKLEVVEGGEVAGRPVRFRTRVNWGSRRVGWLGLADGRVLVSDRSPAQAVWSADEWRRFDAALGRLLVAASKVPGLLLAGWRVEGQG